MLNSKDIVWLGPDIPCLQLCKGDNVSEVVYKIAERVCCVIDDLDISKADYSCIIDKSKTYGDVDLFLFFTMLLKNDCDIHTLIQAKIDANDTTELLVDSLDLKCFLQPYLDKTCTIIKFYNTPSTNVNPNEGNTIFNRAEIETQGVYYVSDDDRSVWEWSKPLDDYIPSTINPNCICDIELLDLDVQRVLQVIIDNLCQTKSSGVIKACDALLTVPFDTVNPNTSTTIFTGLPQIGSSFYISNITHSIWRWVPSENTYLPSILTTSNIDLTSVDSCLLQSEVALQNWISQYKVYQEPTITSCLGGGNILSNHVELTTDAAICELKNNVGSERDVYYSGVGPCSKVVYFTGEVNSPSMVLQGLPANDLYYLYINKDYDYPFYWNGFQYTPFKINLAFTESNQWDALCNLLARVKNVESTCCTPTCDNTTIGFSTTYNSDDNIFTLTFDSASGTNISEDFTDCGSVLTATDSKGVSVSLDIELSQDVVIELDASTLDLSQNVNVNIKSCLSNGTLTCKNCYSQSLPIIEKCGLCKLCAVDNSDTGSEKITVYYTVASNPSLVQSSVLYGGQCLTFSLPEDLPTIKSIVTSNSGITLENDPTYPCNDISVPAAVADTCWFFEIPFPLYTADILMDKFENNGSLLGCISKVDFDLAINTSRMETYEKYYDYNNPNGVSLSGNIANVGQLSTDGSFTGSADSILTILGVPTYNSPNILGLTQCTGSIRNNIRITKTGSGTGVSLVGSNDSVIGSISPAGIGGGNLLFNNDYEVLSTNRHGFILKVQGQPTNINGIQKPEIALKNPINGALTYIKGELLADDCNCPS